MPIFRTLTMTSAIALAASPALADLTAAQVWSDWQSMLDRYGATVTSDSVEDAGRRLSVSNAVAEFEMPEGNLALRIGDIVFEERGDGSVAITLAEEMPFTVDIKAEDGDTGAVGFTLRQPGGSMIASGDAANLRYDFDYPLMQLTDFTVTGDGVPEDLPVAMDMTLTGNAGHVILTEDGDLRGYESVMSLGSMSVTVSAESPAPNEGSFNLNLAMSDIRQETRGTIGTVTLDQSAAGMIEAGMRQSGTASYGPASYNMDFTDQNGSFQVAATTGPGDLSATFDEKGLAYGGTTRDIAVTLGGSTLPLPPVTIRIAESGGSVVMPVIPSQEPQDFALVLRLAGVEVDDMLWGIFDPAGQLPRDPATVILDLAGKAIVTEDFTAPDYAEDPNAPVPGTVEDVRINALELALAGARLTGDGAFTFDNSMGMPMPAGVANFMLTGANGLMDTLVAMGLLPEEQAMMARMTLGLFARPGDGPDTLVSVIEMTADGQVLANGQRVK